jgi:hypothetical protein
VHDPVVLLNQRRLKDLFLPRGDLEEGLEVRMVV